LDDCPGVAYVSALGVLKELYLNRCAGVSDVSALGQLNVLWTDALESPT